ncbi:abnormal spindle-like microcephaly-associated protein [Mustelus asterias]
MEVRSAQRSYRGIPAAAGGGGEDVPVLTLTHFARTPFVCFNTVRTGCSKTEVLAIENPESVPVLVAIDKFPSSKGFAVSEREFVVEPAEKYYLTITWTPVDAGGVRETVTFNVGCVKVLCVLLGKAENPPKKKRSLWETIKRKKTSEGSALLKPKRSASIASKTIIISQKVEPRSPLQSCENLSPVGDRIPPLHDPSEYDGHKIMQLSPILPPSQKKEELENCTPLSLKCYTTYSVHKSNGVALQNERRLVCDKKPNEPFIAETFLEPMVNLVYQPVERFSIKTPTHFPCISAPSTPFHVRRILSPDSFVNDSYVPDEDAEPVVESSVLSPDQFLKDTRETMNQPLSRLSHVQAVEPTLDEIRLQSGNSSILERSNEQLGFVATLGSPGPALGAPAVINVEELEPAKSRLTFLVKSKTSNHHQSTQPHRQHTCQSTDQTKQLPVYTATGAKTKSIGPCELERKVKLPRKQAIEVKTNFSSQSASAMYTETENRNPSLVIQLPISSRKRRSSEFLSTDAQEKDPYVPKRKSVNLEQSYRKSSVVKKYSSCGGRKQLQKRKSVAHVRSSTTAQVKPGKLMPGVAQSHFAFRKLTKTVIPRHPMPFAAKNMFYDEQWKEKQERGFTWWLNFILTPDDFTVNTESSRVNTATLFMGSEIQHHKVSVPAAPTNEEMSLRAYTAKCRLNRLRRAACRLFTSEGMVKVIQKLEAAIEAKHLVVRKDRYLWKDIGERQKILKWLLSYNPLWLRIGLECVFGELIPLESNSDVIGIAEFILNRLLWNSDITAAYRHPTVPHLYRDEHKEVLAQFTLKKFLLLVWFLDCAKQSRLIDHDPCLFCKDAEFKASKDLLLAFSRDFLSGEGDISRHLGYFGLTVSHVQTPLHEFNFAITNIAVDLRCGIRLVRAVELLTRNWKLSKQLRAPAISRLQKLHNVEVALSALKSHGVDLKDEQGNLLDSRDIVDGHREKTLALLWRIIFAFQVEILLNEDQLQEEIEFLQKNLRTQHKLEALRSMSVLSHPAKDQDVNILPEKYSPRLKLLMNWINAVCEYYDVKVENFTVAFSDGRVLCYLIHHYHPGLLAADNICSRTMQTVECAQRGTVAIDTSTSDSDESSIEAIPTNLISSARLYEELLENEKKNFNLVTTAVAALGGVPAMIRYIDMSNTIPEEKVVITYVSFLCARLLDLRKETRAARIIQAAWRKCKLNRELQLLQVKDQAACIIQATVRRFLHRQHFKKKKNAAIIIQALWRGHVARRKAKALIAIKMQAVQNEAATLIQAYWRGYTAQRQLRRTRHYCILIQSHIRMKIAVTAYQRTLWATLALQRHFRAHLLALAERRNYLQLKQSAVIIQSAFRRWKACKLEKQTKASIILQKYIRGFLCRCQYKRFQRSISLIQIYAKGYLVRTEISKRKTAIVTLQKHIKAYVTGKREYVSYQRLKCAAVVLQAAYRGLRMRKFYLQTKSAIVIQSTFRMFLQRKRFIAIRKVVVTMQTLVRMQLAQIRFQKYRRTAIILQRHIRAKQQGRKAREHYLKLRQATVKVQVAFRRWQAQKRIRENRAAITIQSWYRMYRGKQRYLLEKQSCIRIQAWYRYCIAQRAFRTMKMAVLVIQKYYLAYRKGKAQREKYVLILKAALAIQVHFRGMKARQLARKVKATCVIQSYWQMRKERLRFLHHRQCVIVMQAHVRRWQARRRYYSMKAAACVLQAHFRAILAQKKAQSEYKAIRSAVIVLQSAYRGLQARRQFWLLQSVVKIQSAFRAYISRKKFMQVKNATIKIQASVKMIQVRNHYRSLKKATTYVQRHYRANKLCLEKRKEYLKKREACICLQSAVRLYLMQKQLRLWRRAAVKIQSMFRMHRLRRRYLRIHFAAILIQRGFRVYREGVYQRQNFLRIKEAVISLQAAYKGYKVRKMIKLQHTAATKIQAAFRGHASRVKYLAMQKAVIAIQRWYRCCKVGQQQRFKYLKIRTAVIVLQAVCRGISARKKLKMQHKASVAIQTAFRRFKAQQQFEMLRNAALTVQRRFKAKLMGRKERQMYLTMRQSALTLQAAYKGMIIRKEFRRKLQACITIQSYFRMQKMRTKFQTTKRAALILQDRFRAHLQRKHQCHKYQNIRTATIVLQAAFRAMKTRKKLKEIHKAATIIQAAAKCFLTRKRYITLKAASVLLQKRFRALVLSRKQRGIYLSIRNATLVIQAAYRGMKVRQEILHRHKAATVIQATFRMYRVRLPYQALRLATVIIQVHYRAHFQMKTDRENYMKIHNSVLHLQAAYRGMIVRKHLRSMHAPATLIQSYYRMYKQRQCYKRLCCAAIAVQRRYRACKVRDACVKQYNDVKKATIHIQAIFRGMKTRREIKRIGKAVIIIQRRFRAYSDRKTYLKLRTAATTIQQRYRALLLTRIQQQKYSSVRDAAVTIQAAFRGMKVRQEIQRKHKAATVIQAAFRMHRVCLPYQALRLVATIIQTHYRAHLQMKTDRENYSKIRNSVLLLQAAYRGMIVRKHLRSMHASATLIQSYYRMYKQRQCYKRLCWATTTVQRTYRACKVRDACVKQYNDVKKATIHIQAVFRGMKTRREIQRIGKAVIIIQRRFRAYSDRKTYLKLRTAATTIQQRYRALLLTRIQQQKYSSVRNAAVTIQAAFRGMKVRQAIQRRHQAATVIQAAFQMHRVRLPYRALRLATVIIQAHYRAHLQMKTDRENYMKIRNSVLLLQAAYRGMIVRKHWHGMHKSATLIQSYYRMYKQHQGYKRLCWAVTTVQQRYRACKVRDACVKQYNDVKKATIHIQAIFRGMKTRREIKRIGKAVIIIQRRFRAYSDRKTYLKLRTAATTIQQRYRALLLTRIQQQKYSSVRDAAVTIQAAFRGMKVRQEIQRKHKAATVIQAAFQMHRVRLPYRALRLATTIIQTRYRARLQMKTDRENYSKIRNSVLLLQAAYRGMIVRKHLRSMHASATLIQSYYRMHRQWLYYKRLCWAATAVQRRYQACKVRDACVKQYNDVKKAAISFQAFYRGKKGRELAKRVKAIHRIKSFLKMCITRKLFLIQKSAVIKLQAAFRGYRTRIRYRAMRFAAISIQNWYRACKMGHTQLVQYQSMKHATVRIQAAYRGMVVRHWFKQKRAAVKIQSILCMIRCRRIFLGMKSAAIIVQSHYRALEARKQYTKYKVATVVLQRHYRSYLLMKQQRSTYLTLRRIAISLQARRRGVIAQRSYKMLLRSTTTIQACYRRKKQRKIFLLNKKAICVIQQHYRAYCQRKIEQEKYLQMKRSAVVIQNAFRRHQARQLAKKMRAAQKIQAWFKAQIVRRQYKSILNSVIFIKQRLRAKRERSRFLKIRAAAIIIQQRWKMTVATRKLQQENLRKMMAAIKIQAFWKGFKTRKQLIGKHEAACQIQLAYRSYNQRKKFLRQRIAAIVIQRFYRNWQLAQTEKMKYKRIREATILLQSICRGWLVRKKIVEHKLAQKNLCFAAAVYHHLCALKIQRMYRQYRVLKCAKEEINSVICIQRWFRTCLQRSHYLDDRRKIIVVQRTVKVWLMRRHRAAVVIQKVARHFLSKTRKQRFHGGIIKIQALWKGYCLRKKTSHSQIINIRRRIEQANQNSTEEQKLCNRTAVALDYVLKFRHFSDILAALQHLEVATRLSSICCENLARSGATPIILSLIRSCNRSVPSMDVIKCAIQVLFNLSKYQKTSAVVYEVENSINTLLNLLQVYRGKAGDKTSDKCGSIFTKVCCLMALLSKDSQRALEIRSLPRVVDRIRSIYQLTVRKHKMDMDRINVKLRMSAPCNGVSYIPVTPVRTRLVSKLKPDWVLRRDNMKEIVDPLKAIQLVVDTLGISI